MVKQATYNDCFYGFSGRGRQLEAGISQGNGRSRAMRGEMAYLLTYRNAAGKLVSVKLPRDPFVVMAVAIALGA
jgi:hypothetical protein